MSGIRWRTVKQEEPDDDLPLLEAVLEHYDVQLSDRRVQRGSCPLHEDRTPSMSIDLNKQLWNCHSCGKGGNSLTLIALKEVTDHRGARRIAATLGFATGGAGGSGDGVSEQRDSGSRFVSRGARNQPGRGGYRPSWRRG